MSCLESLYQNKNINRLIQKIAPKGMIDDFKQELFLILAEKPEAKLSQLESEGQLISYACRIAINMTCKGSNFFKYYRASVPDGYFRNVSNEKLPDYDFGKLQPAQSYLEKKLTGDINECHEALIFQAFMELGSIQATSEYFNVPYHHISNTVNKVRRELRKTID